MLKKKKRNHKHIQGFRGPGERGEAKFSIGVEGVKGDGPRGIETEMGKGDWGGNREKLPRQRFAESAAHFSPRKMERKGNEGMMGRDTRTREKGFLNHGLEKGGG